MPALADALARLYARIPLGMLLGLDRMHAACARVGHPERALAVVHVAGTNGKGSVCAMVESIARAQGLRTGLYTSPHLCRFAERIRLGGEPLDDADLGPILIRALDAGPDLSFFEVATLAALMAFREAEVDLAVLEVGIGGRLDATNVVPAPVAAAVTRIALDHTDRLGATLVEIAREKAGIAKPGLDLVVGLMPADVRRAIDEVAHAAGATTSSVDQAPVPLRIGLAGEHQKDNARIAAVLGRLIGAPAPAIEEGIAGVRWPGRLERVGDCLLDAAHNPDGAESLARHLGALGLPPERVVLVFGTLADKDWAPMLDTLAPLAATRVYVAPQRAARTAANPLAMAARHPGHVTSSVADALSFARAVPLARASSAHAPARDPAQSPAVAERLHVVAGSSLLVGEARALLLDLPSDPPVAL